MTDPQSIIFAKGPNLSKEWIRRRYAREKRFRLYGLAAIAISLSVLVALLATLASKGWTALAQTEIALPITIDSNLMSFTD